MKISNFFKRVAHRFWSTSTSLLLVRPSKTAVTIPEEKRCPGELREGTEETVMDCGAFEDPVRYVPIYRSMLEKGDIVLLGYLGGRCVFRYCMQLKGIFEFDGCVVRSLNSEESYIHYIYCAPEGRGNHFQLAALDYTSSKYLLHKNYTIVKEDNIPSLKSFYQSGYDAYSLLTVKNRLFHRTLTERILTQEERLLYRV